jgi:hypothetical protein
VTTQLKSGWADRVQGELAVLVVRMYTERYSSPLEAKSMAGKMKLSLKGLNSTSV